MPKNYKNSRPQRIQKQLADKMFEEAKKPGVTIAHCVGLFGLDAARVVIDPSGQAEIYDSSPILEIYGEAEHIRGLYVTEVHRKSGALRRVVQCEPAQLQIGDKLLFENEDGKRLKSDKIVDLEHIKDIQTPQKAYTGIEILYSGRPPQY